MQIESLRKIVQDVDAAPNLHAALEVMVHLVAEAMETEVCSVYLLDERNQRYILMASVGLNPDAVGEVSLSTTEGLIGLVGQREEIISLEDASSHPRFRYLPETGEERYSAFLGVPIMYRRKVMGVMVVQNRERRAFSEAAESFLVTLCAQLSGAIAHAHAVGQVRRRRKFFKVSLVQGGLRLGELSSCIRPQI
jgi:phosphotransferase system enzyme I (PtsP)